MKMLNKPQLEMQVLSLDSPSQVQDCAANDNQLDCQATSFEEST